MVYFCFGLFSENKNLPVEIFAASQKTHRYAPQFPRWMVARTHALFFQLSRVSHKATTSTSFSSINTISKNVFGCPGTRFFPTHLAVRHVHE
jgi:hypothetical protein